MCLLAIWAFTPWVAGWFPLFICILGPSSSTWRPVRAFYILWMGKWVPSPVSSFPSPCLKMIHSTLTFLNAMRGFCLLCMSCSWCWHTFAPVRPWRHVSTRRFVFQIQSFNSPEFNTLLMFHFSVWVSPGSSCIECLYWRVHLPGEDGECGSAKMPVHTPQTSKELISTISVPLCSCSGRGCQGIEHIPGEWSHLANPLQDGLWPWSHFISITRRHC